MAEMRDIPYLVQLLDDRSDAVRAHVAEQLRQFGPALEPALAELEGRVPASLLDIARGLVREEEAAERWREAWRAWPHWPDTYAALERALELLAEFQYDWRPPVRLCELLDGLAQEYRDAGRGDSPVALSRFLFITKGIRGDEDGYYDPLNSNLIHVVESGRGIPITLACLYMLVGRRLGMQIVGCNVPKHFLARAEYEGRTLFVDCFSRGRVLTENEVLHLRDVLGREGSRVLAESPDALAIMTRVLRNLVNAYNMAEDFGRSEQTAALLVELRREARASAE